MPRTIARRSSALLADASLGRLDVARNSRAGSAARADRAPLLARLRSRSDPLLERTRARGIRTPTQSRARPTRRGSSASDSGPEPEGAGTDVLLLHRARARRPGGAAAPSGLPASWQQPYGESHFALLPYEAVRASDDPRETLLDFLQSAYDAGALLAGWDRDALRSTWCPRPAVGL